LDKELNNYVMRCREWYGWHFPELGKLITDAQAYAKVLYSNLSVFFKVSLLFENLLPSP